MLDLLALHSSTPNADWISLGYSLLLAAVLAGLVAWTYEQTFRGLSFSRNFVQAMILSSMVVATVMQAIGDNVARGLGMMGALAIVRFRTNIKDPKDLVFFFASIAAGLACGVFAWTTAIAGTVIFCAVAFVLWKIDTGAHLAFDGLLRFTSTNASGASAAQEKVLRDNLRHFALISLREVNGGQGLDYAYQVKLRTNRRGSDLLHDLSTLSGISGLHFMMQEATTEL
ncbi:MAG: hypothetical protein RL318_2697 [Fibrobacterota bacterium]|jgi:uncharacterized membrane protein YhiD involved in acid resistance